MSAAGKAAGIQYALVSLDTGSVLEVLDDGESDPRTEGLASAASELLRSGPSPDWPLLFGRFGSSHETSDSFREIILMSTENVYIVERLSDRPNVALVAVSLEVGNLGEALSGIRKRLARLRAA